MLIHSCIEWFSKITKTQSTHGQFRTTWLASCCCCVMIY